MASLIVCTPGGATDNSYVTLAQANTYYSLGLRNDDWLGYGTQDRERALIQATADIENLGGVRVSLLHPTRPLFPGIPYDTSNTNGVADQGLHFPRTVDYTTISSVVTLQIPANVRAAVCEQALWLLQQREAPDLLDRRALQAQGVAAISIDGHAETFGKPQSGRVGIAPLAWEQIKPYVAESYGIA